MARMVLFIKQVAIIAGVSLLGDSMARSLHLPIPGNVLGMILLFVLLSSGIIKVSQVQDVAGFFLNHMPFFFVPVAVALMNARDFLFKNGFILVGSITISVFTAFLVFAFSALFVNERRK